MTKILIADDESDIREVVKVYGELNGYEIDEAGDGIETLDKIKNSSYDLVIPGCHDAEAGWFF
jgi:two-component system response regulator ResD